MISEIIKPGMEAEIRLEQGSGHIYKSRVTDIFENDELELAMPQEDGKVIMLPIGVRHELVFYAKGGAYQGTGIISERYKANNQYMLRAGLKSSLHRIHRQEYCRMSCAVRMNYYKISMEQAVETAPCEYGALLDMASPSCREGVFTEMNGAGAGFWTKEHIPQDSYALVQFQLPETGGFLDCLFPVHIVSSFSAEGGTRFENTAEFIIRDQNVREGIIRYIFDEGRKNRNRERSADEL